MDSVLCVDVWSICSNRGNGFSGTCNTCNRPFLLDTYKFIQVHCTCVLYHVCVTLSHYGKIGGPVRENESPSCRYGYFHSIRGCGRTKSNFFFLACLARFAGSGSCLYFSDCNSVYRCYFPTRKTWDGFWYLQYFPSLCLYVWGGYCWNFNK